MLEDFLSDVGIKGRNRVIHDHNVRVGIDSSSQTHSSFLSTGEIDTFLTNFGLVSCWQDFKVSLQLACLDGLLIAFRIELIGKQDVVLNGFVLDPWSLLDIGDRTFNFDRFIFHLKIRRQKTLFQPVELVLRRHKVEATEAIDFVLRNKNHIADYCLK